MDSQVLSLPEERQWQPGDIILQRYKIEQLFSGAMGRVYIAQHLGWNIPVAIKVPKPEVLADQEGAKRIFTEAESWVRMGMHPNVATCFYIQSINAIPHLFIEYVDGGDLSTWIKTGRCRDLRTALSMAIQFCHGMEFTHSKGIIHRDIKPQNILVTKNALVKITDFGIVQSITAPDPSTIAPMPDTQGTEEGTIGFRGTPGYASPEQFRDTHNVDRRTDIFSFGICLWLIFCSRKPYANNQVPEPLDPSPPPGGNAFPPTLPHLLKKSVAFDPKNRYQDFSELRSDLNRAYIELYRVDCPYMEIDFTDLEAENYNNRAVSFLELGKSKEAESCLAHALEINDALPEAIFNNILLRWQSNRATPSYLLRQLEAISQRLPKIALLETLAIALKEAISSSTPTSVASSQLPSVSFPEYRLCFPKNSVDAFRTGQLHLATQRNVSDLLAKGHYADCHEILTRGWGNIGYRKDRVFLPAYEQLLVQGRKKGIKGVTRLKTLPPTGSHVDSPILIPGTNRIFYLSPSGKIMLRTLAENHKPKGLEAYRDVTTITYSATRGLLAFANPTGIHLLSIKSGKISQTISITDKVTALSFTPDGTALSFGQDSGNIVIMDLATGKTTSLLTNKKVPVRSLVHFDKHPDCISGHDDGTICLWDKGTRECLRQLTAHAMPVTILSPTVDGSLFLSGARDRNVKIWNRKNGRQLSSLVPHEDTVNAAILLQDNAHFLSAGDDDLIKIWEIESGRCLHTLEGGGDGIRSLFMGAKPHIFLAGRNDGAIIVWMVIYDLEFP
ncbi:MAG: protein kinase [Proteobacteria bacterium]|nr:protein kinase [Pseudomonadota bacterium]MDP2104962.1 serine/threonine-protein kinase [Desulfobulbaceae bacterium]